MLKILLEETEFKLRSEISSCSPYTLWFCQVVGLEITSRKKNCEGMVVSHQRQNDKSDRALGINYQVLKNPCKRM